MTQLEQILEPYCGIFIITEDNPEKTHITLYTPGPILDGDREMIAKAMLINFGINSITFRDSDEYTEKLAKMDKPQDRLFPESLKSALDVQVGGDHYKRFAIQPIEYTHKNNLNFIQGNIIKYATRYKFKGGIKDLEKVKHYADLLIELEYGKNASDKA